MGCCTDCCRGMASGFLLLLNSLTIFGGLAILGLGAYGYATRNQLAGTLGQTEEFIAPTMIGLMATGGAIFVMSLIGFSGTRRKSKPLLGIYLFFMVILAIIQLASGSFFFVTMGELRNVATHNSNDFEAGSLSARINDYQLALFNSCCHDPYPVLVKKVESCEKAVCTVSSRCACIVDVDYYNSWTELDYDIQVMCEAMSNVTVNYNDQKTAVVGSPISLESPGSCGNGEGKQFQDMVYEVFQAYGQPVGATIMIICAIQIAAILFASMLCCCFPKVEINENKEEEDRLMEA